MNGLQQVQVFSIGLPPPEAPKDKRRYRVKWRIDRRDKTRTFKIRAQAERLRSRLAVGAANGEHFDVSVGLPESWLEAPPAPSWWSWSEEWVALKWALVVGSLPTEHRGGTHRDHPAHGANGSAATEHPGFDAAVGDTAGAQHLHSPFPLWACSASHYTAAYLRTPASAGVAG